MGAIVVGESVGDDVVGGSVLVGIGVGLPDGELLGLNVGEVDTVGEELGHGPAGVGRVESVGLWLGLLVGTNVGDSVGELDGKSLNAIDGADEGGGVGDLLGIFVGCLVGNGVGPIEGDVLGLIEGLLVGLLLGLLEGLTVGPSVGALEGSFEGSLLGFNVGSAVVGLLVGCLLELPPNGADEGTSVSSAHPSYVGQLTVPKLSLQHALTVSYKVTPDGGTLLSRKHDEPS